VVAAALAVATGAVALAMLLPENKDPNDDAASSAGTPSASSSSSSSSDSSNDSSASSGSSESESAGSGTYAVPNVIGHTEQMAKNMLSDKGFDNVDVARACYQGGSSGKVISQNPGEGTEADPASTVNLKVQADCATVPNVIGETYDYAVTKIKNAGFTGYIGKNVRCDSNATAGAVLAQAPAYGGSRPVNSSFALAVQGEDCGGGGGDTDGGGSPSPSPSPSTYSTSPSPAADEAGTE
jgi:serine/threonine-protein kinase